MSEPDVEPPPDADALLVRGDQAPSTRLPLDRQRIIAAAIGYIDEFGLSGLSMRRLGGVLGVEAMSLYRYVSGKEDLLDGVVDALVEEMSIDEGVLKVPQYGWQDFLQRLAHGVRRVALSHPQAFPLVASRPPEAPWLRPPLRSIEWVQIFLSGLMAEGFERDATADSYRAFTSFLLGHLLLEVAGQGADVGPLDAMDDDDAEPESLHEAPLVEELRPQLSGDHAAAEFEESLEHLLNRLETIRHRPT